MQYVGLYFDGCRYWFNDFDGLAKVGDLVVVENLDDYAVKEVAEIKDMLPFSPTKNLVGILDRKTIERHRESVKEGRIKDVIKINELHIKLLKKNIDQKVKGIAKDSEKIEKLEAENRTLRVKLDE